MSRILKRSLASIIDQAMLSGLNFCMGVFLIRHVAKDDYGLYVQLFALGVLLCGVIDALIGNTIANQSSRVPQHEMPGILARMQALARTISLVMGVLAVVGFWLVLKNGVQWQTLLVQALVFGAYISLLTIRDFKRSSLYLRKRGEVVLQLDGVYVAVTAIGTGILYWFDQLSITSIFFLMALANGISTASSAGLVDLPTSSTREQLWVSLQDCWAITRWAMPGVIIGWATNSSYLFITSMTLGPQATAELNASRLLLMPLTLVVTAWYQMARADIADFVGENRPGALRKFIFKSAAIIAAPSLAYLALLALSYPLIKTYVVRPDYTEFDSLFRTWLIYFVVYTVKFVGMGLLVGFEAYRQMFNLGSFTMLLQMAGVYLLTLNGQAHFAIYMLIATECIELASAWFWLLPKYLKKMHQPS